MKKKIIIVSLILLLALGGAVYKSMMPDKLGTTIPVVVGFFETSLASKITSSATTMTLVTGTDGDGTTLSGIFGFVIDEGTSSEEVVIATCAGTACSSMRRGISVLDGWTEVTANKNTHRRGASVKMTNFPQLAIVSRIMNGDESFPNEIFYNQYTSPSTTTALATKRYVDDVGAGGMTASNIDTDRGLSATGGSPEQVGINLESLSGLTFSDSGAFKISTSTGSGLAVGADGVLKVATSTDTFAWANLMTLTSGFISNASSTIIGDFRVDGNATTTGSFDIGGNFYGATTTFHFFVPTSTLENGAIAIATSTPVIANAPTERTSTNTSYEKLKEIYIKHPGSVAVTYDCHSDAGTNYGRAEIYVNGSLYSGETTCVGTTYITYPYYVTGLSAGDLIQLYGKVSNGAGTLSVKDFKLYGIKGLTPNNSEANINVD